MKKKILVIDDDATIRFLLKKLLEDEFEVISMHDGFSALDWLNSGNIPDLILLDVEMPNINGSVIIRRVRFTPALRSVPVIILSGIEDKEVWKAFKKMGANDYIPKPFKEIAFKNKIHKAMNLK
jgi:two-component system, chemotaxis family, chemotaxis protein CheY